MKTSLPRMRRPAPSTYRAHVYRSCPSRPSDAPRSATYDRGMDVNDRAVFRCMRTEIAAKLAGDNGGGIVNIASITW